MFELLPVESSGYPLILGPNQGGGKARIRVGPCRRPWACQTGATYFKVRALPAEILRLRLCSSRAASRLSLVCYPRLWIRPLPCDIHSYLNLMSLSNQVTYPTVIYTTPSYERFLGRYLRSYHIFKSPISARHHLTNTHLRTVSFWCIVYGPFLLQFYLQRRGELRSNPANGTNHETGANSQVVAIPDEAWFALIM